MALSVETFIESLLILLNNISVISYFRILMAAVCNMWTHIRKKITKKKLLYSTKLINLSIRILNFNISINATLFF